MVVIDIEFQVKINSNYKVNSLIDLSGGIIDE
jgi:hypothetical protein